jgi:2'-hydroxyisoflavone reductase
MKLLLLGGTNFLGPQLVQAALARGHELTLFNRGQRNPGLFPQLEQIHGDRNQDLAKLSGREWDAVIDTSGYVSSIVRKSAQALAKSVGQYVFISTISVYADQGQQGIDEQTAVARLSAEVEDAENMESYGARKALCERAVEEKMAGRALIVRPGLIVGPGDQTDRFTYWPWRVARGGEMLAPGDPKQQTQFIDVRDLAVWIIGMVEKRAMGVYNATGPDYRLSFGEFLESCRNVTESDARFVWVSDAFQEEQGIDFPLYAPEAYKGIRTVNCEKAIREGLSFRAREETILDTLEWKDEEKLKAFVTWEEEQRALRAWKQEQK